MTHSSRSHFSDGISRVPARVDRYRGAPGPAYSFGMSKSQIAEFRRLCKERGYALARTHGGMCAKHETRMERDESSHYWYCEHCFLEAAALQMEMKTNGR